MSFEKQALLKIQELVLPEQKVLIAVSGGQDSIALAYLFSKSNIPFAIAHCNFQLRGVDSDLDETIVREMAVKLRVPFHLKRFNTADYCAANGLSVQEAARELRYNWFEILLNSHEYDFVSTAHHQQDSIETAIFNLTKGTGIRGLHGIPEKRDRIIRPLVKFSKRALEKWANTQMLAFRMDHSNLEDKYARNKIRLKVLPVLAEINTNFESNIGESLHNLEKVEKIYKWAIEKIGQEIMDHSNENLVRISISKLQNLPEISTLLFEILKPYSFSKTQISQIAKACESPTGQIFNSPEFDAIIDRDHILIQRPSKQHKQEWSITSDSREINTPLGNFTLKVESKGPSIFSNNENEVYLDYDKLIFPLTLRTWRSGDKFCPLGLGGKHQKIQDFYSNNKINQFEKSKVLLLCNGNGSICWVVGHRLDERYKISDPEKKCLNIIFSKD